VARKRKLTLQDAIVFGFLLILALIYNFFNSIYKVFGILGVILVIILFIYVGIWVLKKISSRETTPERSRQIPSDVKQAVWVRDGGKCVLCGSTVDLEYDHDIPFSQGGSNSVNNIRLLCQNCNRSKHNKIE
jgi:hypothetical protein